MMRNIENITEKIIEDARKQAQEIIAEARQKKEKLIKEKEEQALDEKEKLLQKAKQEVIIEKERMISQARLQARDEVLLAKQEVIEKIFALVKEKLRNLDKKAYIEFLQKQLATRKWHGSELLFVPKKYLDDVVLLDLPVKVVTDEFVESGFLIKDGNIITNYSFDALVDFYRDELEPIIARDLFAGLE